MLKLIYGAKRRPELTREEFDRHWIEHHAPLVRTPPAARSRSFTFAGATLALSRAPVLRQGRPVGHVTSAAACAARGETALLALVEDGDGTYGAIAEGEKLPLRSRD